MLPGKVKNHRSIVFIVWLAVLCLGGPALLSPARAALAPETFADLAQNLSPAVVNISAEKVVKTRERMREFFGPSPFGGRGDPLKDFFDKFFGDIPREHKQRSLGSGFIVDAQGTLLTNNHVIEGADKIKVKLAGGKEYKVTVKGRDPKTDLAILKIEGGGPFPFLSLGDSDAIRVGDWVIAVGNPFGLSHTVTQGIISAKGRVIGAGPYDNFLQTDAAINPGNSGGPLVNLKGEVVGINTAIVATGQGIGFAIPSNVAKTIIPQLMEKGKVVRGMLGVQVQTVTAELAKSFGLDEARGALVAEVNPGTPAQQAGLQRGDIIIEFNGIPVKEMHELPRLVAGTAPGTKATLKVLRQGKEKTFSLTVAELKEEKTARVPEDRTEEPLIGLTVENLDPNLARQLGLKESEGVVVVRVTPGSTAAEAGLRAGDLILEINGKAVKTVQDYRTLVAALTKDSHARFLIKRQGHTLFFTVEVPAK
ncbi:MAG: DegQ family serine endoprotease [Deltaproteobacteria bacterium]|nr:DegQ family serine endoprotease [Deltaproteobacteria bacterium]